MSDRSIGWQEDDTYVPCSACGWGPPPEPTRRGRLPGRAVVTFVPKAPGNIGHYGDCSTVPQISQETRDRLIEMDRVRRRGAAQAANYWIG